MFLQPKKLKKEISFLWKNISKSIEANEIPARHECQELIKKAQDYTLFADRAWSAQWQSFCRDLTEVMDKVKNAQLRDAKKLIKKIKLQKKVCHKQFKK